MKLQWVVMALLLAGACKKKDNEALKTKATAIRDKALACADIKCARAAEDEYIALTKDLSGLSDGDSKLVSEMMIEIRKVEARFEALDSAPPAAPPAAPPPAAKTTLIEGKGVSVEAPDGWKRSKLDPNAPNADKMILTLINGEPTSDAMRTFAMTLLEMEFSISSDECTQLATKKAATEHQMVDGPFGKACEMLVPISPKRNTLVLLFASADGKRAYSGGCEMPIGDTEGLVACRQMLASLKFDPKIGGGW